MDIGALAATGGRLGGGGSRELGSTDFMRLLTEQLKNQNPLQPTSDGEFLGQLAQFSALEQAQSQSASLERLAAALEANAGLQGLAQAATLIGKRVTFIDSALGTERAGDVKGVKFENGLIQLDIGGELVPLGNVVSIDGTATEPAAPGDGEEGDGEEEEGSTPDAPGDEPSSGPPPGETPGGTTDGILERLIPTLRASPQPLHGAPGASFEQPLGL